MKTGIIHKIYYLEELKAINLDLKELFTNSLLMKLFKKYSELTRLTISLRREIVYHQQPNSNLGIYEETLRAFINLFDIVKGKYGEKKFRRDKNLREISEIIDL